MLKQLNLPEYSFRITGEEGSRMIFDQVRRKYVKLTDEEWVRQNFVQYLVQAGKYPASLMIIEGFLKYNGLNKRVDILVHNRKGEPVLIVECKSTEINIDKKVQDQLGEYNFRYSVPYVLLTNGLSHYAFKYDPIRKMYEHMDVIPLYEDILV